MNCKQLAAFLIILSSISVSFSKSSNTLPLFGLEIPSSPQINALSVSQDYNEELRVLVTLKEPSDVWKNDELSGMTTQNISNLKTVMRDYIISGIGFSNIFNYYNSFNGFSAKISHEDILSLLGNSLIESISEDEEMHVFLDESVEITGAVQAWNKEINGENLTGKGQTVCVIDTGINYAHSAFGSCSSIYNYSEIILDEPIITPNHPNNYPNNYDLSLIGTISMPGYDAITLYFELLDTEINHDFINLYDSGNNLMASYSGYAEDIWSIEIPGDTVYVYFKSDYSINYSGVIITKVRGYNYTSSCRKNYRRI
jgi:subtilisin family serine protease